jgi:hypothetical protein
MNRNKSELFWKSLNNLINFDPVLDRLIFLDCSDNPTAEGIKCINFMNSMHLKLSNILFIKRRNWCMNQGGIMDYVRLVGEGVLEKPLHTFFMQDHFLNKEECVKGDTIPEQLTIDLDAISSLLLNNPKTVVFAARYGFRVCATVPSQFCGNDFNRQSENISLLVDNSKKLGEIINGKYCNDLYIYYNGQYHINGSEDLWLAIDGSNFCLDPQWLIQHYKKNKKLYTEGLGDYTDALVWEARFGKIFTDQKIAFHELSRNITVHSPAELKEMQQDPDSSKLWCYFYNS